MSVAHTHTHTHNTTQHTAQHQPNGSAHNKHGIFHLFFLFLARRYVRFWRFQHTCLSAHPHASEREKEKERNSLRLWEEAIKQQFHSVYPCEGLRASTEASIAYQIYGWRRVLAPKMLIRHDLIFHFDGSSAEMPCTLAQFNISLKSLRFLPSPALFVARRRKWMM
jgi:hypothetical protein